MESDPRAKSGPEGSRFGKLSRMRSVSLLEAAGTGLWWGAVLGKLLHHFRGRLAVAGDLTNSCTDTRIPSRPPEAHLPTASGAKTAFQSGQAPCASRASLASQDRSKGAADSEPPPMHSRTFIGPWASRTLLERCRTTIPRCKGEQLRHQFSARSTDVAPVPAR